MDDKKEDSCRITVKNPYVKVTEVEILNVPEKIYPGDKAVLETRILPEHATRREVKWESSDEQIVKVSEDEMIEAFGVGTAVIRATSVDGAAGSRTIEVLFTRFLMRQLRRLFEGSDNSIATVGKRTGRAM